MFKLFTVLFGLVTSPPSLVPCSVPFGVFGLPRGVADLCRGVADPRRRLPGGQQLGEQHPRGAALILVAPGGHSGALGCPQPAAGLGFGLGCPVWRQRLLGCLLGRRRGGGATLFIFFNFIFINFFNFFIMSSILSPGVFLVFNFTFPLFFPDTLISLLFAGARGLPPPGAAAGAGAGRWP